MVSQENIMKAVAKITAYLKVEDVKFSSKMNFTAALNSWKHQDEHFKDILPAKNAADILSAHIDSNN